MWMSTKHIGECKLVAYFFISQCCIRTTALHFQHMATRQVFLLEEHEEVSTNFASLLSSNTGRLLWVSVT